MSHGCLPGIHVGGGMSRVTLIGKEGRRLFEWKMVEQIIAIGVKAGVEEGSIDRG